MKCVFLLSLVLCVSAYAKEGAEPKGDPNSVIFEHVLGGFGKAAGKVMKGFFRQTQPQPAKAPAAVPKKTKVVNLCYHRFEPANYAACKETERILKSEECAKHVELVEIDHNLPPEQLEQVLKDKKLPSGTVVLIGGHMAGASRRANDRRTEWLETQKEYEGRLASAEGLGFAGMTKDRKVAAYDAVAVRKAVSEGIVNPVTWVSSCHSGGLCERGVCMGTSCQPMETTTMKKDLKWLDPATKKILDMLCDPSTRDVDKDGDVDKDDTKEAIRCDARRYPPKRIVSGATAKRVAESRKISEEEAAIYYIHYMLAELLFDDPSSYTDIYAQGRATELQRLYPKKWQEDQGLLIKGGASFDLEKWKKLLTAKKNDAGDWEVHFPKPDDSVDSACYWGGGAGLEPSRPSVENFALPDPNHR